MDFEHYFNLYDEEYGFNDSELNGFRIGFEAGQKSEQEEIDNIKAKVQEIWTELDDRQPKGYIIEKCESIIQEILR